MSKKTNGLLVLGLAAGLAATSIGNIPSVQAKQNDDSSNVGIADKVGEYIKNESSGDSVAELTAGKVTKEDVKISLKENTKKKETIENSKEEKADKAETKKNTTVEAKEYPQFKDRAVVKADGKVNIRKKASKDSDVVGTLEKGGICLVKKKGKKWTKVASGSCVGYISNDFLLYGDEAGKWSEENGVTRYAKVTTPTLKVRESKDENSDCITLIPEGEEYYVLSSSNGWIEVEIDEESGFVKSDYVDVRYENPRAVSVAEQEEADRIAKEEADQAWLAYLAEQEQIASASAETAQDSQTDDNGLTDNQALKAEDNISTSTDALPATEPEAEPVPEPVVPADNSSEDNTDTQEEPAMESETETPEETTEETPDDTNDETTEEPTPEEPTTEEPTTEAPTAAPAGQSGVDLANYACQFIGYPYVYGGTSLTGGADCSGFVLAIYAQWGISLPHDAELQANYGTEVSLSDLQPGDLLFYPSMGYAIGHVGIYIGDGMIVHASNERDGIKTSVYNYKTPVKATRLLGQ